MKNVNGVELPNDLVESYGLGVSRQTCLGYYFNGTSSTQCGTLQTVPLTANDVERFIEEVENGGEYYFDLLRQMFD